MRLLSTVQWMARRKFESPPPHAIRALADADGRLALRVTPGAREQAIAIEGERLIVKVRAKPQDGEANEAVIAMLARALETAPSRLRLLRGAQSREKLIALGE